MSQTPPATASNSNYRFIFDNALEAYRKKTKKDLRSHPLLAELHACNSPDAVLTILRGQIDQSRRASSADGRLTSWLSPTVNVLYTLSAAVGEGISLVSIRRFGFNLPQDLIFVVMQVYPLAGVIFTGIGVLLSVSILILLRQLL